MAIWRQLKQAYFYTSRHEKSIDPLHDNFVCGKDISAYNSCNSIEYNLVGFTHPGCINELKFVEGIW